MTSYEDAVGPDVPPLPTDGVRREPRCDTARRFLAPGVREEVPGTPGAGGVRIDPALRDQIKHWSPEAQQRALDLAYSRDARPWRPVYCPNPDCDGKPHEDGTWGWPHARADQRPPSFKRSWLLWLILSGRGAGKTWTGANLTHRMTSHVGRIALVAPTGPDFRDTMVEGESGLLATSRPDNRPEWEPSKKRLTWPNGCVGTGFSAEEPDRLRGPQHGFAWIEEPGHMPLIEDVWSNLLFGLRLGRSPRVIGTTTPKPTKWIKDQVKDPATIVTRVSTYANLDNLADTFKQTILSKYEGTRTGRQELHGEVLEDTEGALWNSGLFQYINLGEYDRIVIGIDPAGTKNKRSDETGIIAVGRRSNEFDVLADWSGKYSPSGWATAAVRLYHELKADALVPEKNYGGDMVREVLEKNGAEDIRIITVTSRRGKAIRAEPVVALYERKRVFHVQDAGLGTLEGELTDWVPGVGDSPNRLDAFVHGITEVAKLTEESSIARQPDEPVNAMPAGFLQPPQLIIPPLLRERGFYVAGR